MVNNSNFSGVIAIYNGLSPRQFEVHQGIHHVSEINLLKTMWTTLLKKQ